MRQSCSFSRQNQPKPPRAFYKASDLNGIQLVVNIRGARYCFGPERNGFLPMLFRFKDERLFYGRYSRNGLSELRSPEPGTTLLQMSEEDAQIQCEKEHIPFQDLYCEEDCSSSKHADDSDLERQGFAPTRPRPRARTLNNEPRRRLSLSLSTSEAHHPQPRPALRKRASPPRPHTIQPRPSPPRPSPRGRTSRPWTAEVPDYITLTQAAGMVKKGKRTLERYKTKGTLPPPVVEGGAGRADLYDWAVMRPWLADTFKWPLDKLPEIHPHTAALRPSQSETADNRPPANRQPSATAPLNDRFAGVTSITLEPRRCKADPSQFRPMLSTTIGC